MTESRNRPIEAELRSPRRFATAVLFLGYRPTHFEILGDCLILVSAAWLSRSETRAFPPQASVLAHQTLAPPMASSRCQALPTNVGLGAGCCQAVAMTDEQPALTVADAAAWRAWLGEHHEQSKGVWLMLAKKSTTNPTSLSYDEALDEALCHGWIDGQVRRLDERTYRQRFTPRRERSTWSKRNVGIIERLTSEGRMKPAGVTAVQRAKADGRWEAAYSGQATMVVPTDLAAALSAEPAAQAMFAILTSQNRYAVLLRIDNAKRADTRARRIERFVAMLARGETPHPQKRRLPTENR